MSAIKAQATFVKPRVIRFALPGAANAAATITAKGRAGAAGVVRDLPAVRVGSTTGSTIVDVTLPLEFFNQSASTLRIALRSGGSDYQYSIAIGPQIVVGAVDLVHSCQIVGWCSALALDSVLDRKALKLSVDGKTQATKASFFARQDLTNFNLGDGREGFSFLMPPMLFDGAQHDIAVSYKDQVLMPRIATFQFVFELLELVRDSKSLRGRARLGGHPTSIFDLALVSGAHVHSIARSERDSASGEIAFTFDLPEGSDQFLPRLAIAPRFVPKAHLFELRNHGRFSSRTHGLRRLSALVRTLPDLSPAERRVVHEELLLPAIAASRLAAQNQTIGRQEKPPRVGIRRPTVVVPVYDGLEQTQECLASLVAAGTLDHGDVTVIADCPPNLALIEFLREFCPQHGLRLVENEKNLGFVATCNAAIEEAADRDIVLLNADTILPPGWLPRLARAAHSAPDIASATPFSNNATILSYPIPNVATAATAADVTARDRLFAAQNGDEVVEIPTGVGFCQFLRRDALDEVGGFDAIWGAGYGEENDWCMRAGDRGWRHVAAAGLYVGHVGAVSFGASSTTRIARNIEILQARYPEYKRLIDDFILADPLWRMRMNVDLERLKALQRPSVLQCGHGFGGGLEQHIDRVETALAAQGVRSFRLRPRREHNEGPGYRVSCADPPMEINFPSVELSAVLAALVESGVVEIHVHAFLNYEPRVFDDLFALGLPVAVTLHDYAAFCPRVTLMDASNRYCGEPDLAACETCVATSGPHAVVGQFRERFGSVAAWRSHAASIVHRAARVVAPSEDCARRIERHVDGLEVGVIGGVEPAGVAFQLRRPRQRPRRRIGILGAIGIHKGFNELKSLVASAARGARPLDFVVIGQTSDNPALTAMANDAVSVTISGAYRAADVTDLLQQADLDLGLLLSVWPETHCYALSEYWQAGVPVLAYDIGAQGARIRATGGGILLEPFVTGDVLLERVLAALDAGLSQLPAKFTEVIPPDAPLSVYQSVRARPEGAMLITRPPVVIAGRDGRRGAQD
jgi:O-antigen biosynthesis protein